jgi:protein-S-isoprenylcysteine O-methyltransferase Ste14
MRKVFICFIAAGSLLTLGASADHVDYNVSTYETLVAIGFSLSLVIFGSTAWQLNSLSKKRVCSANADRALIGYSIFALVMVVLGACGLFFVPSQQYQTYVLCAVFFLFLIVSIGILMKPAAAYMQYKQSDSETV